MSKQSQLVTKIESLFDITRKELIGKRVFICFETKEKSIWLKESYCCSVGVNGGLEIHNVDRVGLEKEHRKILAKLMAQNIGKYQFTFGKTF